MNTRIVEYCCVTYLKMEASILTLADRVQGHDWILVGEPSHGAAEFHRFRYRLTQELINRGQCQFVVLEWDWLDCHRLNEWVMADHDGDVRDVLSKLSRWPEWMWAHEETADFLEWLRNYNRHRHPPVCLYGMDMFGLQEAVHLLNSRSHHTLLSRCGESKANNQQSWTPECLADLNDPRNEEQLQRLISQLNHRDDEDRLHLEMAAKIVQAHIDRHYHQLDGWNVRELHMFETLQVLREHYLQFYTQPTGVVLSHNAHVGDLSYTDFVNRTTTVNLARLLRDTQQSVVLVGGSSRRGIVVTAPEWGDNYVFEELKPAIKGSWEDEIHRLTDEPLVILDCYKLSPEWRPHRTIGAVHHDDTDDYMSVDLSNRYDYIIHFDQTQPIQSL